MKDSMQKIDIQNIDTATADLTKPSGSQSSFLDLSKIRLDQNFAANLGVKKLLTTVPVRKPHKQWFVRVHPSSDYQFNASILEMKEEGEIYVVANNLVADLPTEVVPKLLVTAMNRQGNIFLWPIGLTQNQGRRNEWNESAMVAAQEATKGWVRVVPNMSLGAYETYTATASFPEPEWPDKSFQKLIDIAFREKFIDSIDHPALKKLRGEI
jgi:hypothetical protein